MAAPYPPEVSTFEVVWNARRGTGDTGDAGREPDLYPLEGVKVTFTPQLSPPVFRVPTATPKMTIFQESIFATTNANGVLQIVDEINEGVLLPWGLDPDIVPTGWTWLVLIEPPAPFPPRSFPIAGDPNVPIDLSDFVAVPGNPGEELEAWLAAIEEMNLIKSQVSDMLEETNGAASGVQTKYNEISAWLAASVTPAVSENVSGTRTFTQAEVINTYRKLTLTGNLVLANLPTLTGVWATRALAIELEIKQGNSAAYTVAWPANVKWPDDLIPVMTTGLSRVTQVIFEWNGVDTWRAYLGGEFSA